MINGKIQGRLIHWNDAKGQGLVKPDSDYSHVSTLYGPASEQDIAINISALRHMSRRPKLDDIIFFQIETKLDSKLNAFDASIEGVEVVPLGSRARKVEVSGKARQIITSFGVLSRLVFIIALLIAGRFAYQYFTNQ